MKAVQLVAIPEHAAFYVRDAAKYLGISPNTLRKRADLGLISARRDENGNRVFLLRDLDHYFNSLPPYQSGGKPVGGRSVEIGRKKKGGANERPNRDKRGRKRIVCNQRWPDGKRFRRMMLSRKVAEELDARITIAIVTATWRELRYELEGGRSANLSVSSCADHYLEVYCKVHNKSWKRKRDSLKALKRHLGRL